MTQELPVLRNTQHHTTFLRAFVILEASLWFFILFRSLPVGLVYTSAGKQLIVWHFSKCFLIWAIKIHLNFKTASKTFHMNNIK